MQEEEEVCEKNWSIGSCAGCHAVSDDCARWERFKIESVAV